MATCTLRVGRNSVRSRRQTVSTLGTALALVPEQQQNVCFIVGRMGERRDAYRMLVGKLRETNHLEKPGVALAHSTEQSPS